MNIYYESSPRSVLLIIYKSSKQNAKSIIPVISVSSTNPAIRGPPVYNHETTPRIEEFHALSLSLFLFACQESTSTTRLSLDPVPVIALASLSTAALIYIDVFEVQIMTLLLKGRLFSPSLRRCVTCVFYAP